MTEPRQVQLELPEDLEPLYANLVRVAHTPGEFILDFSTFLPGQKPRIGARIVMSALGIKLLQRALADNLARFEANFGEIRVPPSPHTLADDLFRTNLSPEE